MNIVAFFFATLLLSLFSSEGKIFFALPLELFGVYFFSIYSTTVASSFDHSANTGSCLDERRRREVREDRLELTQEQRENKAITTGVE